MAVALDVRADPITISFTAFPAPGDPVNTGPSTGFFTFDSSLIPADGGQVQEPLGLGVTEVNFRWGTTLFTRANADVGELQFSPTGQVLAFVLGGIDAQSRRGIFGLIVKPAAAVIDDFFAATFTGVGGGSGITYTLAGREGLLQGRLVSDAVPTIPAPTPEPSSMFLLATGAALLHRGRGGHHLAGGRLRSCCAAPLSRVAAWRV